MRRLADPGRRAGRCDAPHRGGSWSFLGVRESSFRCSPVRWSCTRRTAVAPSPTADATRLIERKRGSPTANTPGIDGLETRHAGTTPRNANPGAAQIEAQFGPLRTFVMGASNHPNHTVLARKLQAICAGATPTAATPTCWPRNGANAPGSAANANNAGAGPARHNPVTCLSGQFRPRR